MPSARPSVVISPPKGGSVRDVVFTDCRIGGMKVGGAGTTEGVQAHGCNITGDSPREAPRGVRKGLFSTLAESVSAGLTKGTLDHFDGA